MALSFVAPGETLAGKFLSIKQLPYQGRGITIAAVETGQGVVEYVLPRNARALLVDPQADVKAGTAITLVYVGSVNDGPHIIKHFRLEVGGVTLDSRKPGFVLVSK